MLFLCFPIICIALVFLENHIIFLFPCFLILWFKEPKIHNIYFFLKKQDESSCYGPHHLPKENQQWERRSHKWCGLRAVRHFGNLPATLPNVSPIAFTPAIFTASSGIHLLFTVRPTQLSSWRMAWWEKTAKINLWSAWFGGHLKMVCLMETLLEHYFLASIHQTHNGWPDRWSAGHALSLYSLHHWINQPSIRCKVLDKDLCIFIMLEISHHILDCLF